MLQRVATCCSVLQCVSVNEMRLTPDPSDRPPRNLKVSPMRCRVLQCFAVCRSVSQCVAACCSVLQSVALIEIRLTPDERWGAGVETQKSVRGEVGGWGRVPFNETYASSLSTIYDGA